MAGQSGCDVLPKAGGKPGGSHVQGGAARHRPAQRGWTVRQQCARGVERQHGRPAEPKVARQKSVQPVGWRIGEEGEACGRPAGGVAGGQGFVDLGLRRLVDMAGMPAQEGEVEGIGPDESRVAAVLGFQRCAPDLGHGHAVEEGQGPGRLAGGAAVDQPGVKAAAVGIQADLAAGQERANRLAGAAVTMGTGRGGGDDPPGDAKRGHAGLAFRSGSSPRWAEDHSCGVRTGGGGEMGAGAHDEARVAAGANPVSAMPRANGCVPGRLLGPQVRVREGRPEVTTARGGS